MSVVLTAFALLALAISHPPNVIPGWDGSRVRVTFSSGRAGRTSGGTRLMSNTSPRTQRINLRATPQEVSLLRQAAAKSGLTLTTFMLTINLKQASMILGQSNEQDS